MQELFIWSVPVIGVIGVVFALFLARDVLARDSGTPEMRKIGGWIFEGANAYLRRQYQTIGIFAAVGAVALGILITIFQDPGRGIRTAIAFVVGAFLSGLSGYIGMFIAVQANQRTASAASRSLGEALTVALRAGAVSGFLVVSLSLLGIFGIFFAFGGTIQNPVDAPFLIIGYAFGASFVALFAQLGGGIYTKAADVGADLVGKLEAGLPEDDPRNPAVIADLVGDNVGDCAGRGADLFESTAAENIGAMILGVAIYQATGATNPGWIFFPLIVLAFGLLASIVGVMVVRPIGQTGDPMAMLNRGFYVTSGICAIFMVVLTNLILPEKQWIFALCGLLGLLMSLLFVFITQYYTAGNYRPVQQIAQASLSGPATNIIAGLAIGFETTGLPAVTIAATLFTTFKLGESTGVQSGGIFGTALATMGMLMTAGYILAMDTFGPITDNAGGIVEMSDQPESVRDVTDALDSAGNTTKALTKGYAVGSAALAAFLLFSAYLDEVGNLRIDKLCPEGTTPTSPGCGAETWAAAHAVNLGKVEVFIGGFLGAMLVFLFTSFAIRAVGRAAQGMIAEVRRQWKAEPRILTGEVPPDYAACVDISVRAALREMIIPGLLAVSVPVIVGVLLKAEAAAGMLMVGTMVGVLMANVLNNGGGAWDNAKKFIEAGGLKDENGNVLGKRSAPHDAAVVGDTVGDPFKDTAGPSLHVLIKLLATITLVLAPLFVT